MADQNLAIHTAIFCTVDGQLLTRETKFSMKKAGNAALVKTVALGFSGVTPGSPMMEVTIQNSMPVEDMEYNPDIKVRLNAIVELGVIASGRQTVAKGFLTEVNYEHGVDENAVQSITGVFPAKDFE